MAEGPRPEPRTDDRTLIEDFAPGQTARYRESWERTLRAIQIAMALGPVFGAFVLVAPDQPTGWAPARLLFVLPVVLLYEAALFHFHRKYREVLDDYGGFDLREDGVRFPLRRDKETKEVRRRFLPFEDVDAIYFRGTSRLVSVVWPNLPPDVRAEYGDKVPRALDDYVVIVEEDGESTALEKSDIRDVDGLREALRDTDVKIVG